MKETCRSILDEIHGILGSEFFRQFRVRPVADAEIVKLYRSQFSQCARSYLPIWEDGDNNVACIHLDPLKVWQQQAWVILPHDSTYPNIIASSIRVLPRVLHLTRLSYPRMTALQWYQLEELADRLKSPPAPKKATRRKVPPANWDAARAVIDPANTAEALIAGANRCGSPDAALKFIEKFIDSRPDDAFARAFLAVAKKEAGLGDAAAEARRAFLLEFPWQADGQFERFRMRSNLIAIWRRLGEIIFDSEEDAGPLEPFRGESVLKTDRVIDAALDVSKRLLSAGDTLGAFYTARNGMTLACAWGLLSKEWFKWMQATTASVAPDSPALELIQRCKSTFRPGEY